MHFSQVDFSSLNLIFGGTLKFKLAVIDENRIKYIFDLSFELIHPKWYGCVWHFIRFIVTVNQLRWDILCLKSYELSQMWWLSSFSVGAAADVGVRVWSTPNLCMIKYFTGMCTETFWSYTIYSIKCMHKTCALSLFVVFFFFAFFFFVSTKNLSLTRNIIK